MEELDNKYSNRIINSPFMEKLVSKQNLAIENRTSRFSIEPMSEDSIENKRRKGLTAENFAALTKDGTAEAALNLLKQQSHI